MPAPDTIRILPGGLVTSKPPHLIGDRGAAPFTITPTVYDGFQNLINLNGEVAWSFLNGSTDEKATGGVATLFLGGNTKGVGDNVDVATQELLAWIVDVEIEVGVGVSACQKLVVNGEITTGAAGGTNGTHYGAYGQLFTTGGTVALGAGSNVATGAGTAWTTDILTANYAVAAADLSRNKIEAGDILVVGAAGSRVYYRIIEVTDATHLKIFPTPSGAVAATANYAIIRTGYGSWSRIERLIVGANDQLYGYYAGNAGVALPSGTPNPGTVEAVAIFDPTTVGPANEHFQAPKSVDSSGAFVTDIKAVDVIYYKGFLLYGAGSAISWSAAGFPGAVPFGPLDFPAKNIEVLNRTGSGRFVAFERVGDQVIGIFEDCFYLCTATGSVPEFAFYKMPELLAVEHAARAEPCGIAGGLSFGRPTCSGRGAFFYVSNRGLEQCSGGLAEEETRPVSDAITRVLDTKPYFLSWDNAFDLVFFRRAFAGTTFAPQNALNTVLCYAVGTQTWSTLVLKEVTGAGLLGITAGVSPKSQLNDEVRLLHVGYYEVLTTSGTPGTNGGDIRHLTTGLDRDAQHTGLVDWVWNTPVIPLGLEYPDFQFGGFMLDMMTTVATAVGPPATPADLTWQMYAGSSPYNMVLQQGPVTLTPVGAVRNSTWTFSNDRLGMKEDLAFVQFRFNSKGWAQLAALILFNANTQARR